MAAHSYDGSIQREAIARVWNGTAWTDENDNLWAWNGTDWRLIQPDPVLAGSLLPVINLTVVSVTDTAVVTSWAYPAPDVVPTEVQVRIPEISTVWLTYDELVTLWSHPALNPSTSYQFQVRLRRVVDAVVTHTSPVRSVFFNTVAATGPSAPAPDPGGSGSDSIITWPSPGGTPGPVGGSDCWWEYVVQELDLDLIWADTDPLVTGELDGDVGDWAFDPIALGLECFTVYRLKYREVCNSVPGDWNYGGSFTPACDWEEQCGDISISPSFLAAPFDDAIYAIPRVCSDPDRGLLIEDYVSGQSLGKGPGLAAPIRDADNEWGLAARPTMTTAFDNLASGFLAAINGLDDNADDFSISLDIKLSAAPAPSATVFVLGDKVRVILDAVGSGFKVRVTMPPTTGNPFFLLESAELPLNQYHIITVTSDADGDKVLYINGGEVDTDATGNPVNVESFDASIVINGTPGMIARRVAGWDRVIDPFGFEPVGLLHRYDMVDSAVTIATGLEIASIEDLGGAGIDLVPHNTSSRPVVDTITTYQRRTAWVSGPAFLSTSNGHLRLPTASLDMTGKEITVFISAWSYRRTHSEVFLSIHRDGAYASTSAFDVSRDGGTLRVSIGKGTTSSAGADTLIRDVANLNVYKPQVIAVRCSTSDLTMRVDGVAQTLGTVSGTMPQSDWLNGLGSNLCQLRIGSGWTNLNTITGTNQAAVGEVRVYDRALSDAEMAQVEAVMMPKWVTPPYLAATAGGPTAIGSQAFWYDFADASTVTVSGGNITAMTDKSGNGRNLVRTGTGNIAYGSETKNGLNLATFQNSVRLQYDFGSNGLTYSAVTVFYLLRLDSTAGSFERIFGLNNDAGFSNDFDPKNVYFATGSSPAVGVEGRGIQINVRGDVGRWMVLVHKHDASTGESGINGIMRPQPVTHGTGSYRYITVMGNISNSARPPGVTAEVIGFAKRTTDAEDQRVLKYLADKWAVDLS
jgi:hypothetical protein